MFNMIMQLTFNYNMIYKHKYVILKSLLNQNVKKIFMIFKLTYYILSTNFVLLIDKFCSELLLNVIIG